MFFIKKPVRKAHLFITLLHLSSLLLMLGCCILLILNEKYVNFGFAGFAGFVCSIFVFGKLTHDNIMEERKRQVFNVGEVAWIKDTEYEGPAKILGHLKKGCFDRVDRNIQIVDTVKYCRVFVKLPIQILDRNTKICYIYDRCEDYKSFTKIKKINNEI